MNYSHFRDLSLNAFEMIEALMLGEGTNEKLNLKQAIKITKNIHKLKIDDWIKVIERGDEKKINLILEMIKEGYTPLITSDQDVERILDAIEENGSKQCELIADYVKGIDSKRVKLFDGYTFHYGRDDLKNDKKYNILFLNYIVEGNPGKGLNAYEENNVYWSSNLDEPMISLCYTKINEIATKRKICLNEYNKEGTGIYLFDITILSLAYSGNTNHLGWLNILKEIYKREGNENRLGFSGLGKDEKIYQVLKAKELFFNDYKKGNSLFYEDVLDIYYKVTGNENLIFNFLVALSHESDDYYSLIVETLDKIDFKKSINIFKTLGNLVSQDYSSGEYKRNRSQKLLMEYVSDCEFVKNLENFDKEMIGLFISGYLFIQDVKTLRKFFPNIEEKDDNLFILKLIEIYEGDFYYGDVIKEIQKKLVSKKLTNESKDYLKKRIEEIRKKCKTYKRFLSLISSEGLLKFLNFEEEKEKIHYRIQKIVNPTKKEEKEMKKSPIPIVSKTYLVDIIYYLKEWNITNENWESLKIDWYQKSISVAEYLIRYCELGNVFSSYNYESHFNKYFEILKYFDEKGLIGEKEIFSVKEVFKNYKDNIDNYGTKTKTGKSRLSKYDKIIIEKINEFFTKHNIKEPETKEEFIEKTVKILKNQFGEDKVFINKNNNIEITSLDDFEKLKEILSKLEYL